MYNITGSVLSDTKIYSRKQIYLVVLLLQKSQCRLWLQEFRFHLLNREHPCCLFLQPALVSSTKHNHNEILRSDGDMVQLYGICSSCL